jgi:solute carrier family 13 (sodium-dependent dicarboxylate transporter), member 2/3/5
MTTFLLRVLSGPFAFFAVYFLIPGGFSRSAVIVMATFMWMALWWTTQPVPMAISTILPLIILPASGVMTVTALATLYGQPIFFWIMAFGLMGHAIHKHGLAKRFAIWLLSIRGVANTTRRIVFFHMLACGLISTVISDVGVVAMMIPIGVSVISYSRALSGQSDTGGPSRFGAAMALGTMYGAIAGGCATLAGVPVNVVANGLLERLTGDRIGWFRWMLVGVPVFLATLAVSYFLLILFFPPEFSKIPAGQERLREEGQKMGKMSKGEKNVLVTFLVMVAFFLVPSVTPFLLGRQHPFVAWQARAMSIYVVSPLILLLLFALPTDLKRGQFTLHWKEDGVQHSPWEAMLIAASAVAMTDALSQFGFIEVITGYVRELGISRASLPFIAAFTGSTMTEFGSGAAITAILGNIFIPAARELGFNPASIAVLLANVAIGKAFPWGTAPSVVYASGEATIKDMVTVGLAASILLPITVALVHIAFAPIF